MFVLSTLAYLEFLVYSQTSSSYSSSSDTEKFVIKLNIIFKYNSKFNLTKMWNQQQSEITFHWKFSINWTYQSISQKTIVFNKGSHDPTSDHLGEINT